MNKWTKILTLAVLLIIGLSLIYLFFFLHNSHEVWDYIKKVNSSNTTAGLRLTVIYGIAKLVSIITGLVISITATYKIAKEFKIN